MTTIAKIIRKAEKKAQRQAEKKNRKATVATHNLTFDHQKVIEEDKKSAFELVDMEGVWESPYRSTVTATPTLKEMFHLN